MKTNPAILFCLLLLSIFSCKKETPLLEETPGVYPFEEVWSIKSQLHNCRAIEVTNHGLLYVLNDDNALFSDRLFSFNKITGDTIWQRDLNYSSNYYKTNGELIFIEYRGELLAIDAKTGLDVWSYGGATDSKYLSQFIIKGTDIYAFFSINGWSSSLTELYKINVATGSASKEYSLPASGFNGYRQVPFEMEQFNHPVTNNSLVYVQTNSYKGSIWGGSFYILDITADTIYWELTQEIGKVDSVGRGKGYQPLLLKSDNSLVFNSQEKGTFSINYSNKTINWSFLERDYSNLGERMVKYQSNLFLFPTTWNGSIRTLDLNDGTKINELNEDLAYRNSRALELNGMFFFSAGDFIIVDGQSATIKGIDIGHKIGASSGYYNNTLAVDKNTNYLYFTRGHGDYIVCYKLVEEY